MSEDRTVAIKAHWDMTAEREPAHETVTLRDLNQRILETETICKYLDPRDFLLYLGCGNGYSTRIFAEHVERVIGVDYSQAMIERAQRELALAPTPPLARSIRFMVQDVLNLDFPRAYFDAAVVQRCLINLPTWEEQKKAIRNIAEVLKPGGRFLFIEGSQDGLDNLNMLRRRFGLSTIVAVSHNLNFREEQLLDYVQEFFEIVAVHKFGLYDLISRVVHPLLALPEEPAYDAPINEVARRIASEIPGFDHISRVIGLVLKKRS